MYTDEERVRMANKITFIGSIQNLILTILKLFAGVFGKSGAMIADGIHSLSDFITDFIVIISFFFSKKPADENHNYGHGRIETLATVFISFALTYAGIMIFKSGAFKIFSIIKGAEIESPHWIAFWAAVISIIIKEILYRQTISVGKKINSQAIIANAWHHRADALSSIGAMIGIGGAIILGKKWIILDPLASVVVSIFIIKVGIEIFFTTINELLECSLDKEELEKIIKVLEEEDEIKDYHKIKTRKIGNQSAIEFHILLDKNLNLIEAHSIADRVEKKLHDIFGEKAHISIHVEPYVPEEILQEE